MKPLTFLPLSFVCAMMLLCMPISYAETPSNDVNLHKELAPPKATSGDVEVRSFTREDKAVITEYARHGHVYRVKVQPAGGLPAYYLEDSNGDGVFNHRLPGDYKRLNPPMWVIKRF